MDMGQAISTCFRKYATFSGRALRSEYWWWILFTMVAGIALSIVETAVGIFGLSALASLVFIIPTLAVGWRRLHDIGKPGFMMLLPLLAAPFGVLGAMMSSSVLMGVGALVYIALAILLLVWLAKRGEPGPNAYGPPPVVPAP